MASFYGESYTELYPQETYNKRGGWTKVRYFVGNHATLTALANKTKADDEAGEKKIVEIKLGTPDPQGWSTLEISYAIDILYQWTFNGNSIESSIYLMPSCKTWMDSISYYTTLDEQAGIFNRVVNAIEAGKSKGLLFSDLTNGIIRKDILGNSVSQSIAEFRSDWNTLGYTTDQQTFIKNLYTVRMKDVESYPVNQIVLKKTSLVNDYDTTVNLQMTYVNKAMTKTAIVNNFGTTTPIPQIMLDGMNENYWMYQGPVIEQQNNGKLLIYQEWWWTEKFESFIYGAAITT